MFYSFVRHSRTEPARTILMVVSFLTGALQIGALFVSGAFVWVTAVNLAVVLAVSGWAFAAGWRNNVPQMSTASFWVFVMWLWSGLSRMAFSPDPFHLLWAPFLIVAIVMSIVYIYMSHKKKAGLDA